jgi:hypothetical protein
MNFTCKCILCKEEAGIPVVNKEFAVEGISRCLFWMRGIMLILNKIRFGKSLEIYSFHKSKGGVQCFFFSKTAIAMYQVFTDLI